MSEPDVALDAHYADETGSWHGPACRAMWAAALLQYGKDARSAYRGISPSQHDGGHALRDWRGSRDTLRYLCSWLALDVDVTAEMMRQYIEAPPSR